MNELQLKYGCNPNQKPSRIFMANGNSLPIEVLNGKPGYINFMDAFNGWQLVSELKKATGLPSATSFQDGNPSGAAFCAAGRANAGNDSYHGAEAPGRRWSGRFSECGKVYASFRYFGC